MNRLFFLSATTAFLLLLTGCMYPDDQRMQMDILPQQVAQVQEAVNAYFTQNKILPYTYTEENRKLTTKYKVNFKELKGFLGETPPASFDKGGYFLFVLVDVEKDPTVRLFDLRVNDAVGKVEPGVKEYIQHHQALPQKAQINKYFYTIDYEKLELEPVEIPNPYSHEKLPLIMDRQGKVYIDYRTEVMKKWQQADRRPGAETDLRVWLAKDSLYVPAFSPIIKMEGNEPQLLPVEE
ncbi:hypothetical protein [Thermoactinomyces mirandus]|uniref:Lipoprotein n=1 Tax=Thermoactinomyces mirandus TaxID=2756294 RepID=A0A7W1XQG5_9BACL|nr:hypothetical protein [Thermoactinomyces mirandus]MBA4601292.1 hypothetical protein [Thermoactinomyces mirandus]